MILCKYIYVVYFFKMSTDYEELKDDDSDPKHMPCVHIVNGIFIGLVVGLALCKALDIFQYISE